MTNEVAQMSFHDEAATGVENAALFLGGFLSLAACYREPTFLFFILAFSRGGRGGKGFSGQSAGVFSRASADSHHSGTQVRLCFQFPPVSAVTNLPRVVSPCSPPPLPLS